MRDLGDGNSYFGSGDGDLAAGLGRRRPPGFGGGDSDYVVSIL